MTITRIATFLRAQSLLSYLLAMVMLVMALQMFALPNRSNVRVRFDKAVRTAPFLPDMGLVRMRGLGSYAYSFNLYYHNVDVEQTAFEITPGSCITKIKVNGRELQPKMHGLCNEAPQSYWSPYEWPVFIDLSEELHNGRNTIMIRTHKPEFNFGPVIFYDPFKPAFWIGIMLVLLSCIMIVVFTERITGDWFSGFIMAAGFCVFVHRFNHQGANMFSMDLPGHITYFAHIAHAWEIPRPYRGWSFYHAPLYYSLMAGVVLLADMLRSFDVLTCVRIFSLGFFMTFIFTSAMILRRFIASGPAYYAALALLVFYPSGIMFASRIDSNILFYVFYTACLFFILRWLDTGRKRDLSWVLMMFGYAIATRTNALILVPIIGLAMLYHAWLWGSTRGFLENRVLRLGMVVALLGLSVSLGRTEFYRIAEGRKDPLIVGNAFGLSGKLRLQPATFETLLIPNLKVFLERPLWSVWHDVSGRQYFWNSLLKSSMFGEYVWNFKPLAHKMSRLLLAIIAFTMEGYILHRRTLGRDPRWWMCLITLAAPVAALMANRISYPFACSEDFRYIYPALLSFCGLFGLVMQRHAQEWRPFRLALGATACVLFAVASCIFYMR